MNTVGPIVTALALLPLVPLLRFFDRSAWLCISSSSSSRCTATGGIVFFAQYRAATQTRTAGRFAIFLAADLAPSVLLSTVLVVVVYLSVLLV